MFQRIFKTRPVLANCILSGTLFAVGDASASYISNREGAAPSAARAFAFGACLFGPVAAAVTFPVLNSLGPTLSKIPRVALRVGVEQIFISPFVYTPLYFGGMAILDMQGPAGAIDRIGHKWWPVVQYNWRVWGPVGILNFTLVPPHLRIVVASFASLFWNTFLALQNMQEEDLELAHDDQARVTHKGG